MLRTDSTATIDFRASSVAHVCGAAVLASLMVLPATKEARGQVLVPNPYVTGFEGWTDTFTGVPHSTLGTPNWGVLLTGPKSLTESSDGYAGQGSTPSGAASADGKFVPYVMVNDMDVTPANYVLSAQMATYDDDGFGIVFGYQDINNYYRVSFRNQASSNFGFGVGTSLQKVVNGEATQVQTNLAATFPNPTGVFSNVELDVNGTSYDVRVNGTSVLNGTDAGIAPGKYGFHSFGQQSASPATRMWGTSIESVAVASSTLNKTTTFADALGANWRELRMVNGQGNSGTAASDYGNFRQDFRNGTIRDDSDGHELASIAAPNVDFIGPAVVIDEPGSANWSNYRMATRMENGDDDGIGLLLRVASDNTFYRVNFSTQSIGTNHQRAPRGMSIQKSDNGVWSEIYRDDQVNPKFVPTQDVPFDVAVSVVGDKIKVDVLNDPDGAATIISYAPVVDTVNPILFGSVGLTNWGSGVEDNGTIFSAYGGGNSPLLSEAAALIDLELGVNRSTGRVTLTNNSLGSVDMAGYTISSPAGALNAAGWSSIANNYDAPPGNGSVDPNDAWAILESTDFKLREQEQPFDDGSTLTAGEAVDLGLAWTQSQIEDLAMVVRMADGTLVPATIVFSGGPGGESLSRSDLNADGVITQADWLLFYPNTFADMSSLSDVEAALSGDLDLDGDNDIDDFGLFKIDFDAANGAGAFTAMLSGAQVPEPTGLAVCVLAALGLATVARRRRFAAMFALATAGLFGLCGTRSAEAVAIDFTTFQVDRFPKTIGEPLAEWALTPTMARVANNASPSIAYGPTSILNKRIVGRVNAGTDDDFIGIVLGYQPGNALYTLSPNADYMLIDWKGATQDWDFQDPADTFEPHHQFTLGGIADIGLALSRVRDLPTGDELWQHIDSDDNSIGGVTELARGATLGSVSYPRNNTSFLIDITYTATNIKVSVDGVEQFNQGGSFPDGRLGMYTFNQSVAQFTNFEEVPMNFTGLSATVDRSNGTVTLLNAGGAIDIDYYELTSAGDSLNSAIGAGTNQWRSLDSVEGGVEGAGWVEAGGANAGAIGELNLTGASVGAGSTINLGQAYNELVNAEDLVFRFRLAGSGLVLEGNVSYVGTAPGLAGDFNGDGMVNLADYTVWRDNLGSTTANLPNDPTPAIVDGTDYAAWKGNFGAGSLGSLNAGTSQVPEPSTFVGLLLGLSVASARWIRRSSV